MISFYKKTYFRYCLFIASIFTAFSLGIVFSRHFQKKNAEKPVAVKKYTDKYLTFAFEIFDTIKTNYWEKITDEQLINTYILGIEKLTNKKQEIQKKDKKGLESLLSKNLKEIKDETKKKEFATNLSDIVLANLQPFGRSRLYSQKQEVDLKNNVENRTGIDHYGILNVNKDVSPEQLKKAFEQKSADLKKEQTPEAKEKLAQAAKSYEILSNQDSKKTYDQAGIDPTMENRLITPDIFYIRLNKFSPTTIEELFKVTQKVDKEPGPTTLILDLRDNVGGAIDGLPYFLGPFIGNDQYAYQFYHQGNKEDFKTKVGWLPSLLRYKKVVVLVNEGTQSSAEVMATTLKKYNVGTLVGTKTKGWGTVERVFEIKNQISEKEKYSVFLVHRVTLREDGLPIEGRGVEPAIDINNKDWKKIFYTYFRYSELTEIISGLFTKK